MTGPGVQQSETRFERNARALFDASIESLDARTLSKLNQARHQVLEAAAASRARRFMWIYWAPAGALAAGIVAVALLLRTPLMEPGANPSVQTTAAPAAALELLAAGEDLDIAAEADLDFYAWVAAADAPASDGVGG